MTNVKRTWVIKDADDNVINTFEGEADISFIGQEWADGTVISSVEQLPDVTIVSNDKTPSELLREDRNAALIASDWTQLPNGPLSDAKVQEWATYRQALRDLLASTNPVWPTPPN